MIGEIAAILAALCWSVSAILYKKALKKVGYIATNLVRSAFAVLFLFPLFLISFSFNPSLTLTSWELTLLVIGGLTNLVIGDTFYFIGLKKIGVSRAQPVSASYPLFAMLLAALLLGEALTFSILIGTPLIAVGIALTSMTSNEKEKGAAVRTSLLPGVTVSILAAIFWSVGLTAYKAALSNGNIDLLSANFVRTLALLPFLLLLLVSTREFKQVKKMSKADIVTLAVAGILALGVGGILLFLSQTLIENSRAVPLSSISPLFSLLLVSHYGEERVTAKIIAGTILIVTGVILVTFFAQ